MTERPGAAAISRSVLSGPRALRHLTLAAVAALSMAAIFVALHTPYTVYGLSMASGYIGLLFLSIVLILGPWNVLRSRPNPISTDLRRDVGIWAGVLGLMHVATGIQVHFPGRFWLYFLSPPDQRHPVSIRHDLFGFANFTGLGATLIVVLLLALSNDVSLRALGARRWKAWQRWNYAYILLVIVHTVAYQLSGHTALVFVSASSIMILGAVMMQVAGVWKTVLQHPGSPPKG